MPTGRDWIDLFRATFQAVGREDIGGLYSQEWRLAKQKLTADDRTEIPKNYGRVRRFLRTTNSVLFGLTRRLAPARRVMFLAVVGCIVLALNWPSFSHESERVANGVRTSSEFRFYFDNGMLIAALVLLGLLLAMELVDKINYRDELELARDLQASLIPRQLPRVEGVDLGAHNEIANTVGGDIYDFVPLPDGRLAVLFGDASGHGMAAGLVMAVAHAAFRTQLDVDPAPAAMFATLNRILCRTGGARSFFGGVYLLFSKDGAFTAMVAGHPPPLLIAPDGSVRERIGKGAYPLGIRAELSWPLESGRLEPGCALVLASDGLAEARNLAGDQFGDPRIEASIRRGIRLPAPQMAEAIAADLDAFRGREACEDDVSIAVIRKT